jgi:hypothetical protein
VTNRYSIIISIASHIDLNTLDALARTCRQVRVNLLQFRSQLLTSTLHCENEDIELDPRHTFRYRAQAADWYYPNSGRDMTGNGKVGDCARDMVAECKRCDKVVCRVSCTYDFKHCPTICNHARPFQLLTFYDRTALSNHPRPICYNIVTVESVKRAQKHRSQLFSPIPLQIQTQRSWKLTSVHVLLMEYGSVSPVDDHYALQTKTTKAFGNGEPDTCPP